MKITYINHSGFMVETEASYYIFDYYKGELPELDKSKVVFVFCSHCHYDHFNPKIFELLDEMGMKYQVVLAEDIHKSKYPSHVRVTTAYHDKTYDLDHATQVRTLRSNDSGVAFLVETKEGRIYHAGDLNDWYWNGEPEDDNRQMTAMYRAEIDKMKGIHFDVAFVPLDPRQEDHYADGMTYFLENVECDTVFPMHYWGEPKVIDKFVNEYPQYKSRIKNSEWAKGEKI